MVKYVFRYEVLIIEAEDMKLRIAICDDEKIITDRLHSQIQHIIKSWSVSAFIQDFNNGDDLLYEIDNSGVFEIIFMDIEIGKQNGIKLAKILRDKNLYFLLIFISQYDTYYRTAFEVQPFWFLDKPFTDDKLELVLKKAIDNLNNVCDTFDFSYNKIFYRVPVDNIMYFESNKRTIIIKCDDGKQYICYDKLDNIEKRIESSYRRFIRIHRSFYVNQKYIKKYNYEQIELFNGTILCISALRREKVREIYMDNK